MPTTNKISNKKSFPTEMNKFNIFLNLQFEMGSILLSEFLFSVLFIFITDFINYSRKFEIQI